MWTDLSEERITSNFKVENWPSKQPACSRRLLLHAINGDHYTPPGRRSLCRSRHRENGNIKTNLKKQSMKENGRVVWIEIRLNSGLSWILQWFGGGSYKERLVSWTVKLLSASYTYSCCFELGIAECKATRSSEQYVHRLSILFTYTVARETLAQWPRV
jgi:hypothetical protein